MKFRLIKLVPQYRKDPNPKYETDWDCKILGARRESSWKKTYFLLNHNSEDDYIQEVQLLQPPQHWMLKGRNHQPTKDIITNNEWDWWEREIEDDGWWIEFNSLEDFTAFVDQWDHYETGAIYGEFDAD